MAPSAVNDGVRGLMAAAAKYRDDMAGAIVTAGTSTAYTVFSYQGFDTLAHLGGLAIAFTPHTGNGATVTLNVDGLGAKPLRSAPGVELPAAVLVQGTPYVATYNNTDGASYLQGFYGNPYGVMIGGLVPFAGSAPPNSFVRFSLRTEHFCTAYATLFFDRWDDLRIRRWKHQGDWPDLRGRGIIGLDINGSAPRPGA